MKPAALALLLASACATAPVSHPKARVIVRPEKPAHGAPCPDKHIDVVEGPVPHDAIRITNVTTEAAASHVSLHAHEDAAKARAADYCADGVSVLQAEEAKGGVARASMVFWRNRPEGYRGDLDGSEGARERARDASGTVDAGVADSAVDGGAAEAF